MVGRIMTQRKSPVLRTLITYSIEKINKLKITGSGRLTVAGVTHIERVEVFPLKFPGLLNWNEKYQRGIMILKHTRT